MALLGLSVPVVFAAVEMPAVGPLKGLTWLGHASFRLKRGGVVVEILEKNTVRSE